jgi:hypothetical protein
MTYPVCSSVFLLCYHIYSTVFGCYLNSFVLPDFGCCRHNASEDSSRALAAAFSIFLICSLRARGDKNLLCRTCTWTRFRHISTSSPDTSFTFDSTTIHKVFFLSEVKSGQFLFSFLGLEIKWKNQQIIWACLQTVITTRITERKNLLVETW